VSKLGCSMLDTDRGANIITLHDRRHVYSLHSVFFCCYLASMYPLIGVQMTLRLPAFLGRDFG
jgi:hypothetical protein